MGRRGLGSTNQWSRVLARCEDTVRRFHDLVDATEDGPAKDWLVLIAKDVDAEFVEATRLARLGQAVAAEGHEPDGDGTATEILERLKSASRSFDETLDRTGEIVLDLTADTDFAQIRAQLDLLRAEAPQPTRGVR